MVNATPKSIIDYVIRGVKAATEEAHALTRDFQELSWGPEYLLTVCIARELRKLSAAGIFLEEMMKESRDPPKGRRHAGYSPKKRFDIVVRGSHGFPAAAIEVKHRVYNVSRPIVKDMKRLSYAVNKKSNGKRVFRLGILAFYTVFYAGDRKKLSQKEAIAGLYNRLEQKLELVRESAKLNTRFIPPTHYQGSPEIVWGGGCLVLEAQ